MLRSLRELLGYRVEATDGDIGSIQDFFIDEENWRVRYVIVDTTKWLFGRHVLMSPEAIANARWSERRLDFSVTKEKIEKSPDVSTDMPISRKKELSVIQHYGWPPYWIPMGPMRPQPMAAMASVPEQQQQEVLDDSSHLRSVNEILKYRVRAEDGEMGKAADIIVDDESWQVRYLVVDIGSWLAGKKVLISKDWIESISWHETEFRVGLTKKNIENSPSYDPNNPVNREYETVLYDYYGRPQYWRRY